MTVDLDYRIGLAIAASPAGITGGVSGSPYTGVTLSGSVSGLSAGDYIVLNGERRCVASLGTPTTLVVTSAFSGSFAGKALTYYELTRLSDLTTPVTNPKSTFVPYSQPVKLGDGTVRGAGWKTATWKWSFIRQDQRDQLRQYCPGASANVIIRTAQVDSQDAFFDYQAVMVWPQEEARDTWRRTDFEIRFQALQAW